MDAKKLSEIEQQLYIDIMNFEKGKVRFIVIYNFANLNLQFVLNLYKNNYTTT